MNRESLLLEGERLDDLGLKGLMLIQDPRYFCFGIDAVLLSSFARVRPRESVLDLCSGNGIVPVLLSGKTKARSIVGLEIQKALFDMAKRSVLYNKIEDRVSFINGDLCRIEDYIEKTAFDAVTVNPPYMPENAGIKNEEEAFLIARHEIKCNLDSVLRAASYALKEKGRFFMVHRPLRLADIFASMRKYNIEPKSLRLVFPYRDKEPNLVLTEGIKSGNPELRIAPPLVVYESPGVYTKEIQEIYGI